MNTEMLKIIIDILEEKGLIKILNPLTNGKLKSVQKEINETLNKAIKETHASGNAELKRQKEMGL